MNNTDKKSYAIHVEVFHPRVHSDHFTPWVRGYFTTTYNSFSNHHRWMEYFNSIKSHYQLELFDSPSHRFIIPQNLLNECGLSLEVLEKPEIEDGKPTEGMSVWTR